ncbi:TRAP transporter small permease [Metabacillus sp. B2-18]|uniref:TRAP transporter small permease n=1 Tax=Metabacillus sp. B2-18 TaxID=2897333 RepID=UPI001E378A06|nr:TRAP transporter small permease [Metabacillus sp. B2-18]UGB32227.1 TRAP transporter small permease [Metabacillus sp. B2-18]
MNIKKLINEKIEEWLLVAAFLFMVTLVFVQVIFRYVINDSLGWSEELSRYILIWIAWISASYAVRKNEHIRIEFIKNLFKGIGKKVIEMLVLILWFLMALFLAIEGTQLAMQIKITNQVSPSMGVPMWMLYLATPVGGTLMCIRLIQQAFLIFKTEQKPN